MILKKSLYVHKFFGKRALIIMGCLNPVATWLRLVLIPKSFADFPVLKNIDQQQKK